MALHFIFGRSGTGKSTQCCRDIVRYKNEHPEGSACLLVPDQATFRAETMLAAAFPGKGFAGVTVCGFSRLAYLVLKELREDPGQTPSQLAQQLVLRRLLTAHAGEFRLIREAARQSHLAASLVSFFHQLTTFGVDEKALTDAARREGDTPLGRKLSDLALLFTSFRTTLRNQYEYRGDKFDKLAEDIPKSAWLRQSAIWIDGYSSMAPQELAIAAALVRTAREVTVALPMDRPEEAASYPLFERPCRIWEALQKAAGHSDAKVLTEGRRFLSPPLAAMGETFFRPIAKPCSAPQETDGDKGLIVTEAPSMAAEADEAARRIVHLVRDRGLRWRDILVLLPSGGAYEDTVRRSFDACRIPHFITQPQSMQNHPLIVLTDAVLRFLAAGERGAWRGWTKELLFPILKTDLIRGLASDDIDRLENYVLRMGIRPRQWSAPWAFHSPFHLEEERSTPSAREQAELDEMNRSREALLALFRPLEEEWRAAETVSARCAVLYQWLMAQGVPDTLAQWDEETYAASRERPHIQAWKKLLTLLDDLVLAAGNDAVPAAEFLSMAEDGLASLTFSMIPPTLDHVTVTTIQRGLAMEGQAVFLLGATDDAFPARVEESGFFSERETRALLEGGLSVGPDLMTRIHQEAFYAYLALTRARQALYMSYPTSDGSGGNLSPSPTVRRLEALGYVTAARKAALPGPATSDPSFLVTAEQALSLLPAMLREGIPPADSLWDLLRRWALAAPDTEALLRKKVLGFSYQNTASPLPPDVVQQLFLKRRPFVTSVTRMETYRKCPYMYFLSYGLRLEERDQSRPDQRDYGNYLHAGLHLFGDFLRRQQKQWRDATDEDIDRLSAAIADRIAPRVKSGALLSDAAAQYTKLTLDRNFRSALRRFREWSRSSRADTVAMEADFRLRIGEDLRDAFFLDCHVDRVDRAAGAAIVADYKTGQPRVTLGQIVTGMNLQLITYLMAVLESGDSSLLPGAILYIYLKDFTRSVTVPAGADPPPKEQKDLVSGYALADNQFLEALDPTGAILNIKRKNDGSLNATAPVLTLEEMKALFGIVKTRLTELCTGIREGRIPIQPTRYNRSGAPCQYCAYRSICRFDPKLPENRYLDITGEKDKAVREQLRKSMDKEAMP